MSFHAWHGVAVKSRTQNFIMSKYLSSVTRKDRIQTHFYAWRLMVKQQQLGRSREEYGGSIEQLVAQEASTHAKCMEFDDQLQETRLVLTRLKVEKDMHRLEREKLQHIVESSLGQAEGWRRLTSEVISFLGTLKKLLATPKPLIGESNLASLTDMATQTVLGWAGRLLGPLPAAAKVRVTNFGADMKDGTLLLFVLHVLSNGDVDLRVLQDHPDVKARFQIVVDSIKELGITIPLGIDDLFPPTPEMNFLVLYLLWSHFEAPPVPGGDTSLGLTGGYRDDLDVTTKYVELAKSFYPTWLERRSHLQQYATLVLWTRTKQVTPLMLSEYEVSEHEKELAAFSIQNPLMVPSAFLTSVNMSPSQRFQNEEERGRVNAVLQRHLAILRHVFERYATRRSPLADVIQSMVTTKKKSKKDSLLAPSPPQGDDHSPQLKPTQLLVELDVMGFYRLCADCGILKRVIEGPLPAGAKESRDPRQKKAQAQKVQNAQAIATEPKTFSKVAIIDMYNDIALKFPSVASVDDPWASPPIFTALLVHVALMRYGQPILPSSLQPAPAAVLLESFLQKDLIPCSAALPQQNAFITELYHSTEEFLATSRSMIRELFTSLCAPKPEFGAAKVMVLSEFRAFLTRTVPPKEWELWGTSVDDVFEQTALCLLPPLSPHPTGAVETVSPSVSVGSSNGLLALVYGEFEMALAAIAVIRSPSPFMSLQQKLAIFFEILFSSDLVMQLVKSATAK
jgi:hypothetical protein